MADNAPTDVILLSGTVITATTLIRNATDKDHKFKFSPIIFGFLLTASLLILSVFVPQVAKGLAWMGLVGAFALNGPSLFKLLGGLK